MTPSPAQLAWLRALANHTRPRTRRSAASCVRHGWATYHTYGDYVTSRDCGWYEITPEGRAVLAAGSMEP